LSNVVIRISQYVSSLTILLPEVECPYKEIGETNSSGCSVTEVTNELDYIINECGEMFRRLDVVFIDKE
jgi:hypothetical protein